MLIFTDLKTVNTVFYFDINTDINVFEIFELTKISKRFITGMKLRNQKKGVVFGESFKNSLHVNIFDMSLKIFSNGKIHISGNKSPKKILLILYCFLLYCKKIQQKKCFLNYESSGNFYKYKNWYIGKYKGKIVKRIVEIKDKLILVPEELFLIKNEDHFLTKTHIKEQSIYNNIGVYSGKSKLEMISRKNLPKRTSFYNVGKEFFLKYKDQKFGEIKIDSFENESLNQNQVISTDIFYDKIKISKHVINVNTVFKFNNVLNKSLIYHYFYDKKFIVFYNPDKYPAVKCNFYLTENNEITFIKTNKLIKVQFHDSRINISSKTNDLAIILYDYIKKLLLENDFLKKEIKKIKECEESTCWTIQELYELMIFER